MACGTAWREPASAWRRLERKADVGEKLHTTGIIVKDAIDQIALLDGLPATIVRRIDGVRLYAGDAAGMVSLVTAGGIHTALKHGLTAGHAIADFLTGKSADPSEGFVETYPRFRTKRVLRFLFDHLQSDLVFNLLLGTRPMRAAASIVYFHRKGVFEHS